MMTASTYFNARSSIIDRAARRLGLYLLEWSNKRQVRASVSREQQLRQFAQSQALEARELTYARRLDRSL
jgi:hypothetical protein